MAESAQMADNGKTDKDPKSFSLNDTIGNLCLRKDMADVYFVIEKEDNKKLHAHKFILAARSPVFRAMFYGNMAETKKKIYIPDVSKKIMSEFIR